jgi:hypothetical protein
MSVCVSVVVEHHCFLFLNEIGGIPFRQKIVLYMNFSAGYFGLRAYSSFWGSKYCFSFMGADFCSTMLMFQVFA